MPVETLTATAKTKKLVAAWTKAKQEEREANTRRLGIEGELIAALGDSIPEDGAIRVEGLKIVTGFTEKWDQERLQEVRANWPDRFPDFPFREELKAIGKELEYLEKHEPEAYKLAVSAMSQTPKKPAFTLE